MTISPVNVCMSVYGQPEMLAHNLRTIAAYPDEVLDQLTVLIADDCGEPEVDEAFCRQFPERCNRLKTAGFWDVSDVNYDMTPWGMETKHASGSTPR